MITAQSGCCITNFATIQPQYIKLWWWFFSSNELKTRNASEKLLILFSVSISLEWPHMESGTCKEQEVCIERKGWIDFHSTPRTLSDGSVMEPRLSKDRYLRALWVALIRFGFLKGALSLRWYFLGCLSKAGHLPNSSKQHIASSTCQHPQIVPFCFKNFLFLEY